MTNTGKESQRTLGSLSSWTGNTRHESCRKGEPTSQGVSIFMYSNHDVCMRGCQLAGLSYFHGEELKVINYKG